jgi:hypothetical protein
MKSNVKVNTEIKGCARASGCALVAGHAGQCVKPGKSRETK